MSKLLKFWESKEVRPIDVAHALEINPSNSTGRKSSIYDKLKEAWFVLQSLGYEAWVVKDDHATAIRMMAIIRDEPYPIPEAAVEITMKLRGHVSQDECIAIAKGWKPDSIIIAYEGDHTIIRLPFHQETVVL